MPVQIKAVQMFNRIRLAFFSTQLNSSLVKKKNDGLVNFFDLQALRSCGFAP